MTRIAIVETKPSRNDYKSLFMGKFNFDLYHLCSDPNLKKVLKRDCDIVMNPDDYDWVILIGSDAAKFYTKITSVTTYTGKKVDEKYLITVNPAALAFNPGIRTSWENSRDSIIGYVTGSKEDVVIDDSLAIGITETHKVVAYIKAALEYPCDYIALDSETTGLYPRDGHMLGLSIAYCDKFGAYISTECLDDECEELLQELFNKKIVIFHNSKFDLAFFEYHFNFVFPRFEDTMLLHYLINEMPGTHGLKMLAMQYTPYGDYEKPLYDWMESYRKQHGILKGDFRWGDIPFEEMYTYASIDALATFILYHKFVKILGNARLKNVYDKILIPGTRFLTDIQDNGVPFNRNRLFKSQALMQDEIDFAIAELYKNPKIAEFEAFQGKEFNPNSVVQLRKLLFDFLGLKPTGKKTETGAASTDAEVLEELSSQSEVPALILDIRQKSKIKNTYLDKIIPQLDADSRLRTSFNLFMTTSGRLSSSGKLNMQQLPRDNPIVKGCIKARPGYKIVALDLGTAEVYGAAILSGDKALMQIFKEGGDFHSAIAKKVFRLNCAVEDVKALFPLQRQAAKAVTFGIMYGAGARKISEQVTKDSGKYFSPEEAQEVIDEYFETFHKLRDWIDTNIRFIKQNGFIYSFFGRKRRLPDVGSKDRGIAGHAVRSGLNFLVQSVASDINLLGAIDAHNELKAKSMKAMIFALVHDSVLAEVPDEEVEAYCEILKRNIQKDRGLSIPGAPIKCDIEVGDDYSFGKFEKMYGD